MITQKSIHLKLNDNLLVQLDDAVRDIGPGMNRNKLINEAVRFLLAARHRKAMADIYEDPRYLNGLISQFRRVLEDRTE